MKRILYLSHISWNWIKQRPQFIAEQLAKDYIVDVYYRQPLKSKWRNLPSNKIKNDRYITVHSFTNLPFISYGKVRNATSEVDYSISWLQSLTKTGGVMRWNENGRVTLIASGI